MPVYIKLGIHVCVFASHQCADYACVSYAGAGEARVKFAVGEAPWPHHTIIPDLHLHRKRAPSSTVNYMGHSR